MILLTTISALIIDIPGAGQTLFEPRFRRVEAGFTGSAESLTGSVVVTSGWTQETPMISSVVFVTSF